MMQYWKVDLVVYTPVFVGSGEIYNKLRYIYNSANETVSFLREEKWIAFLDKHGIMDDYAAALLRGGKTFSLFGYLQNQAVLKKQYKTVWNVLAAMKKEGVIDREVDYFSLKEGKSPNDIAGLMRDVEGNPYIPGSSLKGAFRTAILSHEIRKSGSKYRSFWKKMAEKAGKKAEMARVIDELERKLTIPDGEDMVKSYFRGLTVSDAIWKEGACCVAAKTDYSVGADDVHQVALFRECLDKDSRLEFTVGIDEDECGMGHFGIRNLDDLIKVLQEFRDFQYDILEKPFEKDCKEEMAGIWDADLFLGGGTGFLTKTLIYSLAPDCKQAVEVTRKLLEKNTPHNHHHEKDRQISPHTLKLVSVEGYEYMMGLCYLENAEKLC